MDAKNILVADKSKFKALKLFAKKLLKELKVGSYKSIIKGLGLDFHEIRPYEDSDDARFIDWNTSAKMNSIFTKVFKEDKGINIHLLVDNSLSMIIGSNTSKRDIQDILIAIFAHMAFYNLDKIGLTFFSKGTDRLIKPARGAQQLGLILQETINRQLNKGSNLGYIFKNTAEYYKKRSLIIIISDFKDKNYKKPLSVLSKRHDVIAIRIIDKFDLDLPKIGFTNFKDIESSEIFYFSGNSSKAALEYKNYWTLDRLKWRKECIKRKINFIEISTEDNIFKKLNILFKRL